MKTLIASQPVLYFLLVSLMLISCSDPVPYPRKHGFHRIEFPADQAYATFDNVTCPFTFNFPEGGEISRDRADSCWVDISFPAYQMTWHISYKNTNQTGRSRGFHFEEHRKLVFKHTKKATQIQPANFTVAAGKGVVHEVYGEVGTPAYYFLYDTTETHIALFSLYFDTALKNDSLMPVIDYMKAQAGEAMQSFRWK